MNETLDPESPESGNGMVLQHIQHALVLLTGESGAG